jgi:hypothetical protein
MMVVWGLTLVHIPRFQSLYCTECLLTNEQPKKEVTFCQIPNEIVTCCILCNLHCWWNELSSTYNSSSYE